MSDRILTVGELRSHLIGLPDDSVVSFSGGLSFYRFKRWGDDEVVLEFGEPQADLSPEFKRRNPHVKVAFIDVDSPVNSDGSISVTVR
ncbi:hypothetical protein [Castellaniella ginsengisoli]|uniref:Uncharacterized protein n=1 Tax=Castellaniella ginsengisoli TaxID=546114 RepID=A0AB39D6C4_9BURK